MTRRPVNRDSKAYRTGYRMAPYVVGTLAGVIVGLTAWWVLWGGH